jgi:uncharacterized protein (TIGR03083 family)
VTKALIDYGRLLDVLAAEAETLASATEGQRPERQVPACPGLNLGETARHVGSTYRMTLSWLRDGRQPLTWQQNPAPDETLADFVRTGVEPLLDELAIHDPEDPCGTWWPEEPNYGFWARRLAHETTVHRMDVQAAAMTPLDPVADDVVADGIDEILSLWFVHRLGVMGVRGTRDGVVAVRTAGRVWLASSGPTGSTSWRATPEEAEPADADVTGIPLNVYRWLWGRISDREVEVNGDHDAIAQLWALLRLATK